MCRRAVIIEKSPASWNFILDVLHWNLDVFGCNDVIGTEFDVRETARQFRETGLWPISRCCQEQGYHEEFLRNACSIPSWRSGSQWDVSMLDFAVQFTWKSEKTSVAIHPHNNAKIPATQQYQSRRSSRYWWTKRNQNRTRCGKMRTKQRLFCIWEKYLGKVSRDAHRYSYKWFNSKWTKMKISVLWRCLVVAWSASAIDLTCWATYFVHLIR